jgi:hypothetical protein
MLWRFDKVYDADLLLADHTRQVAYQMTPPPEAQARIDPKHLFIHPPRGRRGRTIDDATEGFVEATRMGTAA